MGRVDSRSGENSLTFTGMGASRSLNLSEAERQRRSELARQLHERVVDPATGRRAFGGAQPGSGRPRKPRAAELVAEEARKEAKKIIAVYKDAIDPTQPIETRVRAADKWLKVEHDEAALQNAEQRDLNTMSDEDLVHRVAAGLMRIQQTRALDGALSSHTGMTVVEGQAVEVVDVDDDVVTEAG